MGDEAGFFLILFRHLALMIAGEAIQEGHDGGAGRCIDNLIHSWEWIVILGCSFVEVCKINTHPPFSILLLDKHCVL
jgi:hypothetical protein